jgi:CheY-like chemotaxis protein
VPRILVIDDNAAIRELLRLVLEEEGYEVIEAADGAEGLQRVSGDSYRPRDYRSADARHGWSGAADGAAAYGAHACADGDLWGSGGPHTGQEVHPVYVCQALSAGASPGSRAQPGPAAPQL